MPLVLSRAERIALFPGAPATVIDAFVADAGRRDAAGITATRTRLGYALANAEHECGGFAIPKLTENINHSARCMAEVWRKRLADAATVRAKDGTKPGWQRKAVDDICGGRMGNRPGTDDGSRYIGRGCPQITGRQGCREAGKRCGLDLVADPERATRHEHQPAILAAFADRKGLNTLADAGDFGACVERWNGGSNGMADGEARQKGNDPVIARLRVAVAALSVLGGIAPG